MSLTHGRVHSVQVGRSRLLRVGERVLRSAIGKQAVAGPVAVGPLGLAGDEQNDLSVHGGLSKAVYALPLQHVAWWSPSARPRPAAWWRRHFCPACSVKTSASKPRARP